MSWFMFETPDIDAMKTLNTFEAVFIACGAPEEFALFGKSDRHKPVTSYFVHAPAPPAPVIKSYLSSVSAEPCERPSADGLSFICGHDKARSLAM